jgi:hypothetical protein
VPHYILVDYDNIPKIEQLKGLRYIVDLLISNLSRAEVGNENNITIRLYGGWYEKNRVTQRAQDLTANINYFFPNTVKLSDNRTRVVADVELAYSLLCDPKNHLFDTFRYRGKPNGLKCLNPATSGCGNTASCPISHVFNFINRGVCSHCGVVKTDDILYKGEQKLVDSMLISDLIYLATGNNQQISIASSDDDIWPGIVTALALGKTIYHFQVKSRVTPIHYTNKVGKNYLQKPL